jgi:hypothetical protein
MTSDISAMATTRMMAKAPDRVAKLWTTRPGPPPRCLPGRPGRGKSQPCTTPAPRFSVEQRDPPNAPAIGKWPEARAGGDCAGHGVDQRPAEHRVEAISENSPRGRTAPGPGAVMELTSWFGDCDQRRIAGEHNADRQSSPIRDTCRHLMSGHDTCGLGLPKAYCLADRLIGVDFLHQRIQGTGLVFVTPGVIERGDFRIAIDARDDYCVRICSAKCL